jgi:putative endonuclease
MTAKPTARTKGARGERAGEGYLRQRGYEILERNVRSPFGEIDLVARDGKTLVFIEVKSRRSRTFGFPEEAVDQRKQDRLVRLATWYLMRRHQEEQLVRFDVLAVEMASGEPVLRLIQDAIEL